MKQLGHLKSYKMKLTTLSPVFIGGGVFSDLSNLQYIYDFNTRELKIIDETKFLNFLKRSKLENVFIKYVAETKNARLNTWLDNNFKGQKLDIYSNVIKTEVHEIRKLNCIKSFIKNTDNLPYIPASSIKGSISTAIMANLIEENVENYQNILKEIMSHIQIADSKPISSKALMYKQISHQQLIKNQDLMNVDNDLKEILREGIICNFTITLDNQFKYSINELLNILEKFYQRIYKENNKLDLIADDLKSAINVSNCPVNINIGGQSGFNTKVILRALSKDENDYQQRKKEALNRNFRSHNHLKYKIAPRCIKVVERYKEECDTLMPLGWCNLTIAE